MSYDQNILSRWLTNTSLSSLERSCRTERWFFWTASTGLCLAFGFDSGLYSGSISVRVEVHSRYHSGVCGFKGLRIQSKLRVRDKPDAILKWVRRVHNVLYGKEEYDITPTLRDSCPRNSDTIAMLIVLEKMRKLSTQCNLLIKSHCNPITDLSKLNHAKGHACCVSR